MLKGENKNFFLLCFVYLYIMCVRVPGDKCINEIFD